MPLIALGLNHQTAPVDIREKVAFSPVQMNDALQQLSAQPGIHEAAILSTCNRMEIYCNGDESASKAITDWITRFHNIDINKLTPFIYLHHDQEAIQHLLQVATGLNSMILGEPQILGQVKAAYQDALRAGCMHNLLGKLFQHTFSVAKQVRTDTTIGSSPVSVAFAAVSLARQIFGELGNKTALLIGAGETIELTARHLHQHGLGKMIVANRTVERAHTLAAQFDAYAISLPEMPGHLPEADIVISSTASPLPILGKGMIERVLKQRKRQPVFMVDLAVPRDIEPEIGDLADIYLYTVDDLQEVIQDNLQSRQEAAKQAQEIVDNRTEDFLGWMRSLQSVATIRDYRNHAEQQRDIVLQTALQQLKNGKEPEQVLQYMAHTLTNKITHAASTQLRQAGYDGETEFIAMARKLLIAKDS